MNSSSSSGGPSSDTVWGPQDGLISPRYSGFATFARLPRVQDVARWDVAVQGVPFDAGTSYRPGARFGPAHIRQVSRLLRPYDQDMALSPFGPLQVVDAGDSDCNPYDIAQALDQIGARAKALTSHGQSLISLGGDHTVALPLLRAAKGVHGPLALVHFDAHLDTWDTYFGQAFTHGTPFRRASEENLIVKGHSIHVGVRGSIYGASDLAADHELGFSIVRASELDTVSCEDVIARVVARVGTYPVYVSVDIDVLDPSHAPGTGTPEAGGLSSRELLTILRGLKGLPVVGGDVVEVAPAYDVADITAVAASHIAYALLGLVVTARLSTGASI
jgi:agmatinase